jgi:hypothetical protein
MGKKTEVWLPKSQVVQMTDRDENGMVIFTVTKWWHDRAEIGDE